MDLSYGAEKVARRPADESKSNGYRKVEFIAAFLNAKELAYILSWL